MPKPAAPAPRPRTRTEVAVTSRTAVGMGGAGGQKPEKVWYRSTYPTDRHGRRYHVTESTITGTPVDMRPLFRAPVMPPPDCLHILPSKPWHVEIDYPKWLGRLLAEEKEHLSMRLAVARKEYKEFAQGKENTDRVLELTGPAPGDVKGPKGFSSNAKLVALAFHGDPWAIGKAKERTAAVVAIIGEEQEAELDLDFLLQEGGAFSEDVKRLLGSTRVLVKEPEDRAPESFETGEGEVTDDEELERQAIAEAERAEANRQAQVEFAGDDELEEGPHPADLDDEEDRVAQYTDDSPSLRELASTAPVAIATGGKKGRAARPSPGR